MTIEILPPLAASVHVQAGERRPAEVRSGFANGAGGALHKIGRVRARGGAATQKSWKFSIRLWLPLFLFWILLLPLLLLALPVLFVAALIFGIRFWKSLAAVFGVLAATRGTNVEVERPSSRIFIKLH